MIPKVFGAKCLLPDTLPETSQKNQSLELILFTPSADTSSWTLSVVI